jgi:hypothetical protein
MERNKIAIGQEGAEAEGYLSPAHAPPKQTAARKGQTIEEHRIQPRDGKDRKAFVQGA